MRYLKSKDDYHYEIKNCIFSGDTDLLMLGLATHDPYLSLLRNVRINLQYTSIISSNQIL